MPLYIVRWPGLSASLVRAEDEEDLVDILDQVDSPEGCRWQRYDGPVYIDFDLPVEVDVQWPEARPLSAQDIDVRDVSALCDRGEWRVALPDCDATAEMREEILSVAFPHVYKIWKRLEEVLDEAAVRKAIGEEVLAMVNADWRRAHLARSTDPEAQLATMMRTSVQGIRGMVAAGKAAAKGGHADESDDLTHPTPSAGKPKRRPACGR